jgi:aminoglycoside phosphotransferase (APT) family kinase protein
MRHIQTVLLSAIFIALCIVGYELHALNVGLRPLNRIPTSGLPPAGETADERAKRIDRNARRSMQIWDDAAAEAAREKELRAEAAKAKAKNGGTH